MVRKKWHILKLSLGNAMRQCLVHKYLLRESLGKAGEKVFDGAKVLSRLISWRIVRVVGALVTALIQVHTVVHPLESIHHDHRQVIPEGFFELLPYSVRLSGSRICLGGVTH